MKLELKMAALNPIMSIPLTEPRPFTPHGAPASVKYQVREAGFRSRAAVSRETMPVLMSLASERDFNLLAMEAVPRVVTADQRDEVLKHLQAAEHLFVDQDYLKDDASARAALIAEVRSIHAQLARYDSAMQKALADRVFAMSWERFVAARLHLAGWEGATASDGTAVEFVTGADGYVTENCLARIPAAHIADIAEFAVSAAEESTHN